MGILINNMIKQQYDPITTIGLLSKCEICNEKFFIIKAHELRLCASCYLSNLYRIKQQHINKVMMLIIATMDIRNKCDNEMMNVERYTSFQSNPVWMNMGVNDEHV